MVESKLTYNPDFAVHPGLSLKQELEFRGISQTEFSKRSGLSEKHISQIINGESPITPETSIKFEFVLGVPAEFWNNLQTNYDLIVARLEANKRISTEVEEAKQFACYPELVELGYVPSTRDWNLKAESLLKFFGVDSLQYVQSIQSVAFRQGQGKFDERSLAAWLRCGEIEAAKINTAPFNRQQIKQILPEIKNLTKKPGGFGQAVQDLCAAAGIAVVFTPYFKKTRVNGSARWIGDKAVVQLNTKGAYSDIFWFTLFHEIGHLLLHGVKDKFLDYSGQTITEKEKEANEFAANTLIPVNAYREFISAGKLNPATVSQFADALGIGKSIVLGRLAHEGIAQWNQVTDRQKIYIKT